MMKKLLRLATFALLFTGVASAQTTGSITGVVTDGSSGQPVIGAVVVATSPAAPGEQSAVTDAKGAFTIGNLPAGQYKLQASFEGYKPETRADLALGENVTLRANLALTPEAVQMEEVVVTGSRIRRKDLTTAAPVSVVNKEAIVASGKVSVGEFLQAIPEQAGAIGRGNNNGGDGTVRIALRGLGTVRTLVLVNGRRWVPGGAGANASVDLNTLPASAIERIEILKDGASAVYGSDAIGGVVNVITKKNYVGSEFSAYAGTSAQGDGNMYDVSGTFGTASDKGSILISAGFVKQEDVFAGDRSFSETALAADFSTGEVFPLGSGTIPAGRFTINLNNCTAGTLCQQLKDTYYPTVAAPGNRSFIYDPANALGGLEYRIYGRIGTSTSTNLVDDSYNFAPANYLYTPSQRYNFFTSGDYKLNDYAKFYFEGSFMNRRTDQKLAPVPLVSSNFGAVYSVDSMYNPTGIDLFLAQSRLVNLSNRTFAQDTDTVRVVAGFTGNITPSWNWDASYVFGKTMGTETFTNGVRVDLVANALGPSRIDPATGRPTCYASATPDPANPGQVIYSNPIDGCIPLDLLHGPAPADQLAGITFIGPNRGFSQQAIWAGSVSGELIPLLGDRPMGLAAGAEYRTEQGADIPNPFNAAGLGSDNNYQPTQGGYNVTEGFAELSVPIINNAPFIYDLEASLAARYSDYSTFGAETTYKVGLRYSPVRDITVRGTYSTAFRAPSVGELYDGNAESFPAITDPCRGDPDPTGANYIDPASALGQQCGAAVNNGDTATQIRETLGGNPNLEAETAVIYTAGLVIEPRFVENLAITFDYYNVEVKKTVGAVGIGTILNGCYTGVAGTSNPLYCGLIARDANTNFISLVTDTNQNVGELRTAGLDMSVRYGLNAGGIGRFNFDLFGTLLLQDDWIRPDGSTVNAKGTYDFGYPDPEFRGGAGVQWSLSGLSAGLTARYIGGYKECGDIDGFSGQGNLCADTPTYFNNVDSFTQFDMTLGYTLNSSQGKTSLLLGMTNVLDTAPPASYNAFANNADPSTDYMGRFFYARMSHAF